MRTIVLRQPAKTEAEGIAALAQLAASELPTAFNTLEQARFADARLEIRSSPRIPSLWALFLVGFMPLVACLVWQAIGD